MNDPVPERLAFPLAIELHNIVCDDATTTPTANTSWHHRQYTTRLLSRIRMEISIQQSNKNGEKRKILYSTIDDRCNGVFASFHHLNDVLQRADITTAEFDSMEASFHVQNDNEQTRDAFLQVPIHPSRLCRIQQLPGTDMMPLNCICISFSDHSQRIHPAHYKLFKTMERLARIITDPSDGEEDARFEERAFCQLDDVCPKKAVEQPPVSTDEATEEQPQNGTTSHESDSQASQTSECADADETEMIEPDESLLELELQEQIALSQLLQQQIITEQAALTEEQEFLASQRARLQQHATPLPTIPPGDDTDEIQLEHAIALARLRLIRDLQCLYPIKGTTIRGLTLQQPGAAAMTQHCAALVCKYMHGGAVASSSSSTLRDQVADVLRNRGVEPPPQAQILVLLQLVYEHVLGKG